MEGWLVFVRIVSAIGAMLSLVGLSLGTGAKILGIDGLYLIGGGSAGVAIVNIFDFALRWDILAIKHADLYCRFKELQANMASIPKPSEQQLSDWESEAQFIRADEPPTLWALYMVSWNQAVERQDPTNKNGLREIPVWRLWTKNLIHYLPLDFPLSQPKHPIN